MRKGFETITLIVFYIYVIAIVLRFNKMMSVYQMFLISIISTSLLLVNVFNDRANQKHDFEMSELKQNQEMDKSKVSFTVIVIMSILNVFRDEKTLKGLLYITSIYSLYIIPYGIYTIFKHNRLEYLVIAGVLAILPIVLSFLNSTENKLILKALQPLKQFVELIEHYLPE